ncbi:cation diffusion facilitator family transporter [Thiomicrorhabdus sp. Kp2]|uniref:cation diffusion facilitator family transporter n=1 Tax=Thiomicrorhabdus sp. Kp2 TaxID=1123518 RepID=UPI000429AF63|nr:cation diffusion facilitator family transporter [Thiomicrorhabdus sp. Kp2]
MNKARLVRIATYASVVIASLLLLLKLYAWWYTESVSILASLLDSAIDIAASVMIVIAVQIAQTPADKEHRFGHGNAEPLAALAQSVFISGSAVYLIIYSIERFIHPQAIQSADLGFIVMIISLMVTLGLLSFQRYVIRKTQSTAIKADSLHYLSDVLANILVIITLWFSAIQWLDPLAGFAIAAWIFYSAIRIAIEAGNQLLDHELPQQMREEIKQITLATEGVLGMNDLRSYQSGPNKFVQFDLELDDNLSLFESHKIAENVTKKLKQRFTDLDVVIHQEPASLKYDPSHHNWGKE